MHSKSKFYGPTADKLCSDLLFRFGRKRRKEWQIVTRVVCWRLTKHFRYKICVSALFTVHINGLVSGRSTSLSGIFPVYGKAKKGRQALANWHSTCGRYRHRNGLWQELSAAWKKELIHGDTKNHSRHTDTSLKMRCYSRYLSEMQILTFTM